MTCPPSSRHRPVIPANRLISVSLRDLLPSTTYLVAIAASNMIGNSSFSQPVTMVTKPISKVYYCHIQKYLMLLLLGFDPPVIVGVANGEGGSLNIQWEVSATDSCITDFIVNMSIFGIFLAIVASCQGTRVC